MRRQSAAALNVSRTPVRDALTALQLQGLIDVRPQSGSFVFMLSEEDVAELAEFRRVMELTALRFCFARRRDETAPDAPGCRPADKNRDTSLGEHRAMIAAFAKGNLGRAETIVEQHIWRMRLHFHTARRRAGSERRG